MIVKEEIRDWFVSLQKDICSQLEIADAGGKFVNDVWDRPGGGGGVSCILTKGEIIEKGGVNFSAVFGKTPESVQRSLNLSSNDKSEFYATGVSIVIHPVNPMVPIIHMNVRYFEMNNGTWWFGGGIDLTPHYVIEDDARFFHEQLKLVCDKHDTSYYPKFKTWADDYFFIKHRNETRGIGGIFFDNLNGDDNAKDSRFKFVKDIGSSFAGIYIHLMKKNNPMHYSDQEKQWQYLRRGRYVEFNLVWDKGTRFGLDTDGRTESILMSLPPQAQWEYNYKPVLGSAEDRTLNFLKKSINWVQNN